MSTPSLSVLLPVYNAERYLDEAVKSILSQTFSDFEVVIIDDGSTDGSLEKLRGYAARDSRVRLTSRENRGFADTVNEGLAMCRAELVARMDADDVALPERFAHQVRFMESHPEVGVCGTDVYWTDEKGRPLRREHPPTTHDAIMEAMGHPIVGGICHPTAILRRSIVQRVGGYRGALCPSEDRDLWFRCGEVSRLANISLPLLKYRMHPTSMCNVDSDRVGRSGRLVVQLHHERLRDGDDALMRGETLKLEHEVGRDPRRVNPRLVWAWWAMASRYHRTACIHAWNGWVRSPLNPEAVRCLFWAHVTPLRRWFSFAEGPSLERDGLEHRGLKG